MTTATTATSYMTTTMKTPYATATAATCYTIAAATAATPKSDWDVASFLIQSIVTMPALTEITVFRMEGWVMPKEDEGEQKLCSSNVQTVHLSNCKLTDEFFLVVASWFANVKQLFLESENFIIIPECIKECRLLETLELKHCVYLEEIRGIPPNLKYFKAIDCPSMSASCRSMLLNQELHQAGNTMFIVPLTPIPKWFEHQSVGTSVSFWFRNNLPQLLLCLALPIPYHLSESEYRCLSLFLFINGTKCSDVFYYIEIDHTCLFYLNKVIPNCNLSEAVSENKWNFAEIKFLECRKEILIPELTIKSGIHVLKWEARMKDIQFTDPRRKRKLEDDSESQYHQLLKRHKFLGMDNSGTQIVHQKHMGFWSRMWNQSCNFFHFFLLQQSNCWIIKRMKIQDL